MKSALDIKSILFVGGNVVVSAKQYSAFDLKNIAFSAKSKGVHLTIKDADCLSTLDCKSIAFANPGGVTFDFTNTSA